MTGLLCGILLARTTAGVIADLAGWRTVYLVAAALMAVLAMGLRRELPAERPRAHVPYRALLRSTARLFATEPVLRRRCLYGFLSFACFSVLWTSVAFLLKGAPYHYSNTVIGLFGLVGAAGALAANGAGRLADGATRAATFGFALAMALAFAVLAAGRSSLPALIVGILVLDAGSNGLHVLNQHANYSLPTAPDARSRINAVYMTSFFLGGAAGSAASAAIYSHAGWSRVCVLGACLGAAQPRSCRCGNGDEWCPAMRDNGRDGESAGWSRRGRFPALRRGRSGLHRAGCWLTASRGDPQESATENRPPMASGPGTGKGETVR